MKQPGHVDERLSERVVPAVADVGYELLRFPEGLSAVLQREADVVPALKQAERVALPLTDDPSPPTCWWTGPAWESPAWHPACALTSRC